MRSFLPDKYFSTSDLAQPNMLLLYLFFPSHGSGGQAEGASWSTVELYCFWPADHTFWEGREMVGLFYLSWFKVFIWLPLLGFTEHKCSITGKKFHVFLILYSCQVTLSETGSSCNPNAIPRTGIMAWCYKAWRDSLHFFCFVLRLLMSDISGNDFWDAKPSLNQEASDNCNCFQTVMRQRVGLIWWPELR